MSSCNLGAEKLSNGTYLSQSKLKFLYLIFVFMYLVFFTSVIVLAAIKFQIKRRYFTYTNIKILTLSFILYVPLST